MPSSRNKDQPPASGSAPPPEAETGPFQVGRLPRSRQVAFRIEPDAAARAALAAELELLALRKLRFEGQLRPLEGGGWELRAELGATVVQPCGITLAPVTTRIDEPVIRRYLPDWRDPALEAGADAEIEVPDDTDTEALGSVIDPATVMAEALALAVPAFPRAPDANLGSEGAAAPASDSAANGARRPFAALAPLRDRMAGRNPDDDPDRD